MDAKEIDRWFAAVDRMLERLQAAKQTIYSGSGRPYERIAYSENRALDLIGLDILKQLVPESSGLLQEWFIHKDSMSFFSLDDSIDKTEKNKNILKGAWSLYHRAGS